MDSASEVNLSVHAVIDRVFPDWRRTLLEEICGVGHARVPTSSYAQPESPKYAMSRFVSFFLSHLLLCSTASSLVHTFVGSKDQVAAVFHRLLDLPRVT